MEKASLLCLRVRGDKVPSTMGKNAKVNLEVFREILAALLSLGTWQEPFGTVVIPKIRERVTAVRVTKHGPLGQPGASGLGGAQCVAWTGH